MLLSIMVDTASKSFSMHKIDQEKTVEVRSMGMKNLKEEKGIFEDLKSSSNCMAILLKEVSRNNKSFEDSRESSIRAAKMIEYMILLQILPFEVKNTER